MSMDNYDPRLIFDLAAGLLSESEAAAAEAALSAEGRAELEAQRAVMAAIDGAEPARLTDLERARLHRSVAEGIAHATREMPAVVPAAPPPSRPARSGIWLRFASAAAAAAVLVGVVAVGSQLTGGSDGDASADAPLASTLPAASQMSSTTAPAFAAGDAQTEGAGEAGSSADAPAADEGLSSLEESPRLLAAPDQSDLTPVQDFAAGMINAQRNTRSMLAALPCYETAVEDDDLVIADSFLVPYPGEDGEELFAIAFSEEGAEGAEPLVRLYDPATCEPLGDTSTTP